MNYYVFRHAPKAGDQPIKILHFEPNELVLGSLVMEHGPVDVFPEFLGTNTTKPTNGVVEAYIKSILPPGVKTTWKT